MQPTADDGRRVEHLLEVVEHEQHIAALHVICDAGVRTDQRRNLRLHQVGGHHSRQVGEPDPVDKAVGKAGCERPGKRRLADPADARQRHESSTSADQRPEVVQLTHPADQRLPRRLEVLRPIDRTGGKSA